MKTRLLAGAKCTFRNDDGSESAFLAPSHTVDSNFVEEALRIQASRSSSAEVHKKPGHDSQIEESEHDVSRAPLTSR